MTSGETRWTWPAGWTVLEYKERYRYITAVDQLLTRPGHWLPLKSLCAFPCFKSLSWCDSLYTSTSTLPSTIIILPLCFLSRWLKMFIVWLPTIMTLCAVARSAWREKVRCWHTSWRDANKAKSWLTPSCRSRSALSGAPVCSTTVVCAPGWVLLQPSPPMLPSGPQALVWSKRPLPPAPPGSCPPSRQLWCDRKPSERRNPENWSGGGNVFKNSCRCTLIARGRKNNKGLHWI